MSRILVDRESSSTKVQAIILVTVNKPVVTPTQINDEERIVGEREKESLIHQKTLFCCVSVKLYSYSLF